jgi:hypothetical protein
MRKITTNALGMMFITLGIGMGSSQKAYSFDTDENSDDLLAVLKTQFAVPVKFSTEMGELHLLLTNDPLEEDNHYLRPMNLPSSSDFLDISHVRFLYDLEQTLAEEDQLDVDQPALGPEIDLATALTEVNSAPPSPPLKKIKRIVMDNPIYPIKYQHYDFEHEDKFAYPNSVLTVNWKYKTSDDPQNYADLSIFPNTNLFTGYVFKTFAEHVKTAAIKRNQMNFESVKAQLYL